MPHHPHVLRGMLLANAALIFQERQVEPPRQLIFNTPVRPHRMQGDGSVVFEK